MHKWNFMENIIPQVEMMLTPQTGDITRLPLASWNRLQQEWINMENIRGPKFNFFMACNKEITSELGNFGYQMGLSHSPDSQIFYTDFSMQKYSKKIGAGIPIFEKKEMISPDFEKIEKFYQNSEKNIDLVARKKGKEIVGSSGIESMKTISEVIPIMPGIFPALPIENQWLGSGNFLRRHEVSGLWHGNEPYIMETFVNNGEHFLPFYEKSEFQPDFLKKMGGSMNQYKGETDGFLSGVHISEPKAAEQDFSPARVQIDMVNHLNVRESEDMQLLIERLKTGLFEALENGRERV